MHSTVNVSFDPYTQQCECVQFTDNKHIQTRPHVKQIS